MRPYGVSDLELHPSNPYRVWSNICMSLRVLPCGTDGYGNNLNKICGKPYYHGHHAAKVERDHINVGLTHDIERPRAVICISRTIPIVSYMYALPELFRTVMCNYMLPTHCYELLYIYILYTNCSEPSYVCVIYKNVKKRIPCLSIIDCWCGHYALIVLLRDGQNNTMRA
jgi:hypothetical protein